MFENSLKIELIGECNLKGFSNACITILKDTTADLTTSLNAAWVEIEALKQQDEQNKLQLAEVVKENEQLRVAPTMSIYRDFMVPRLCQFTEILHDQAKRVKSL